MTFSGEYWIDYGSTGFLEIKIDDTAILFEIITHYILNKRINACPNISWNKNDATLNQFTEIIYWFILKTNG